MSAGGARASPDERAMVSILQSMGIAAYDPALPAALSEYARRFASEVLCDAKDFSVHAGRNDVQASDINVALKLCETLLTVPEQREQVIVDLRAQVNKRNIADLVDSGSVLHRLPRGALIQRGHTYVPGVEAFGEFAEATASENEALVAIKIPVAPAGPGPLDAEHDLVSVQLANGPQRALQPVASAFVP